MDIKDFLNEALYNKSQDFEVAKDFEIYVTTDIVDMLNENTPDEIKSFDIDDFYDYSIEIDNDDLVGARNMFSWFAGLVKKAYVEDLNINWNPSDGDFHEVADLNDNDHGFVLTGDGDDGRYSIFLFKKSLSSADKKKFKEFSFYFQNSGSIYISELF